VFVLVLPYLIVIVIVGAAAVLVTSKNLAEKCVTAGLLPRTFLGLVPILQSVIRLLGVVLVTAGIVNLAISSGWIDAAVLSRYAFPACLILLGAMLLFLNRRGR
jgi:hypothetical protein